MKQKIIFTFVIIVLFPAWQQTFAADDVLNVIEKAVKQYKDGDFAEAAGNLDYASQLVRQKKSEKMKEILPEPLEGWQAQTPNAQAVGAAILGGGVTVSRDYKKGSSQVSIEIISDSPVLQSVLMMLNNPMFAGASGGKLQTIKDQRAIVKYDDKKRDGDINIIISNKYMVTVKGQNVSQEELILYAQKIDFRVFLTK